MVDIAKCESSSNPELTNKNSNGTTDVGLWQINSVHLIKHPNWNAEWLKIPGNNAIAAAALYHSNKFNDWSASRPCWEKKQKSGTGYFLPEWVPLNTVPNVLLDKVFGIGGGAQKTVVDNVPILGDLVKSGNAIQSGIETTADATVSVARGAIKTGEWLSNPHNWLRILYVGLGAAVVVVGLAKLVAYDSGLAPVKALSKIGNSSGSSIPKKESESDDGE